MEHPTVTTPHDRGRTQETRDSTSLQHHASLFHQPHADSLSSSHKNPTHVMGQNHPLAYKGEAANGLLSDVSSYLQCPSLDGSFGSGYAEQGSYRGFLKPTVLPAMQCASPEDLLQVLSSVQGKLKHLEVILQLMIHERRQQGMHQSLAGEFTSIMLQLFAAMSSGMGQQALWSSLQDPSHGNDTFDVGVFSGFNEHDVNNALSTPIAGLQASLNPSGGGIGGPAFTDRKSISSARRVGNTEVGQLASRPNRGGSMGSFSGLGSTHAHSFKTETTKTAPSEGVDGHDILGNSQVHSLKRDVTKANPSNVAVEASTSHGVGDVDDHVMISMDDQKDEDDDIEGESLPPGSYELIEMAATEILAEHTHFCEICSKGFKRDANLRMHMRGHGDEYKTPTALARPDKATRDPSMIKPRRYSCPYVGCKRNKKHPKFQPLKTMLCVKNHYKRSHCPKLLICDRCKTKKFSVVADLKTHEKHCGQDKWQCSCGTTFSRKDKLLGHIGLFVGHTPAERAQELDSPRAGNVEASTDNFSMGHVTGVEGSVNNKHVFSNNEAQADGRFHVDTRFREHSSSARGNEMSLSFANLGNGALLREYTYPSADGMTSDASELQGLLSDSFFHQGENRKSSLCEDALVEMDLLLKYVRGAASIMMRVL